jgi:succinate-acetate transporter protein
MDTCSFCRSVITRSYYRVGSVMACPNCVETERQLEAANKRKHYLRGLLFGILAAIVGSLGYWAVEEFSTFGGTSLFSFGAYVRGFAILCLGSLVGGAIKAGAQRRSTRLTQITAAALTYLAYTMAIVPQVLNHVPATKITPAFVVGIFLLAPFSPFLAIAHSFIAISGLICVLLAMRAAWGIVGKAVDVTGPYDNVDPMAEVPLFKTVG